MDREKKQANYFGFEKVSPNKKTEKVSKVFSSVADKYDLMNDFMSLGVHRLWKDRFVKEVEDPYASVIDVAGGSGDIALRVFKKSSARANVTISDINYDMLQQAENKFIDMNLHDKFKFVCANAENMPFADDSFGYYTIAFGIRNVTHINAALQEAYRILQPGGKFICLEFSKVVNPLLSKIYENYSFNLIPKIGGLVADDADSYKYLVESIKQFPDQESFKSQIEEAGFKRVTYENLSNGIVAIHKGWKI